MKKEATNPAILTWMLRAITIVVGVSLVAGIFAAGIGGSLNELGSGAGGLYGVPSLLLTLIALGLGLPSAVGIARMIRPGSGWLRRLHLLAHAAPAAMLLVAYR